MTVKITITPVFSQIFIIYYDVFWAYLTKYIKKKDKWWIKKIKKNISLKILLYNENVLNPMK